MTLTRNRNLARVKGKAERTTILLTLNNHCRRDARSRNWMVNRFVDFSIMENAGTRSNMGSVVLEAFTSAGRHRAIVKSPRTSVRIQTDYRCMKKFHILHHLQLKLQPLLRRESNRGNKVWRSCKRIQPIHQRFNN